eukprot:6213577-Pleurochrysis_carterae.AAC.1
MPAPQRVLVLRLERGGRAYDGGTKQARLSVCESKGGPKGGEGGATSGDGAQGLTILSSKSSWCCVAVVLCTTQSGGAFKL